MIFSRLVKEIIRVALKAWMSRAWLWDETQDFIDLFEGEDGEVGLLAKYAKRRGIDPEKMTEGERDDLFTDIAVTIRDFLGDDYTQAAVLYTIGDLFPAGAIMST